MLQLNTWTFRAVTLVLFLCFALAPVLTHAEETKPDATADRIDQLKKALEGANARPEIPPLLVPREFLDEEGAKALKEALRSYYEYRAKGFEHRRQVFAWQLLSSKIIFIVVIVLVAAGIFFSWLQFRAGLKQQAAQAGGRPESTTFEASATGIKVSSPVLGVIILAISLAFFYLYLTYVYPIAEIF